MVCLEQQLLILPIPGCGGHFIKPVADYYKSKGFTVLPIDPPVPWDNGHPLLPAITKALVIVGDPFERLRGIVQNCIPGYQNLTSREVNALVHTGELFRRFPVETMPASRFIQDMPRPRLPNGGRVRVFHENDPRTWGNILDFLVLPRTFKPEANNRPIIGWDIESENIIRNYYEKDVDITPDKSYFL
jgi:hypothetical protein